MSSTTLVVRAYTGPAVGITYDTNYFIPEAQIWGDGRIIWTEQGTPRRVMMARLTTDQMRSLLQRIMQRIMDTGFFNWEDSYGIGGSTNKPWHLSVNLIDHAKEVVGHKGQAPDAYYELVSFLSDGAGITGSDFIPTQGYLTANCWPPSAEGEEIEPSTHWPDADAGFALDQVGNGRYVAGETLSFAWQTVNQNPTNPIFVKSNNQTCVIMVQIPGVSLYEPP